MQKYMVDENAVRPFFRFLSWIIFIVSLIILPFPFFVFGKQFYFAFIPIIPMLIFCYVFGHIATKGRYSDNKFLNQRRKY